MRIPQILLVCAALAPVFPATVNGASDLDVDYAEHLPLVTESMLLDVTRAGDKLVAVGERGHVILSSDGKTWTQAEVVPTRATLTAATPV